MTAISYCFFPVQINCYGITSAYELQILALCALLSCGLRQSNNQLAESLQTDRRTIINSINRLRDKKLVRNTGTKYSRVLTANSEIVSLFNGLNSEKVSSLNSEKLSQNSERVSQNSEKPDTHNKRNKEYNITYTDFDFVLRNNELWLLPQARLDEYKQTFPAIDIEFELRKASQWLKDNPSKRKTSKGMTRFLSGWLGRTKTTVTSGKNQVWDSASEDRHFQNYIEKNAPTEKQAEQLLREAGII